MYHCHIQHNYFLIISIQIHPIMIVGSTSLPVAICMGID